MSAEQSGAAVFVIFDKSGKLVVMETRGDFQTNTGKLLYPGGHLEDEDEGETEQERQIAAGVRECKEEMGIHIQREDVTPITCETDPVSPRGTPLHPFAVRAYEGVMPEFTLDEHRNPLVWVPLEEGLDSPIESVGVITRGAIDFRAALTQIIESANE